MIRAEIIDTLVPGHGKPVDERFSDPDRPWMRGTGCVVDNGPSNLDVGLMRFGRAAGRYQADSVTEETLVRSATVVAREVLSRL